MPDAERPGQLKNGFNITARDLDRAFMMGKFEPYQTLLIGQARELSYTSAKLVRSEEPLPFHINLSALARDARCSRPWLSKQFNELVDCKVFVTTPEGLYRINKDFRTWLDANGQPRLDPGQIRWCRSFRKDKQYHADLSSIQDTPCPRSDTPPVLDPGHPLSSIEDSLTHFNTPPPLEPPCESAAPAGGLGTGASARGIESSEREREKKKPLFFSPSGSEKKPDRPDPGETFRERDARLAREHKAEMKRIMQDPEFYKPRFPPSPLENNNGSAH